MHVCNCKINFVYTLLKLEFIDALTNSVDHKSYMSTYELESLVATGTDNACT